MKKQLLWLLAVPLLLPAFVSGVAGKKGDEELAQGTWVVVSVEVEGKPLPKEDDELAKSVEFVITGDKIVMKVPPEQLKGKEAPPTMTFTIDPKAMPRSVDIKFQEGGREGVFKGIYALEGDKLTVCLSEPGAQRPTDFTTKDRSKILGVFKRKVK